MSNVLVVDVSPELFWFVSNSLSHTDIVLKHLPDAHQAERIIINELPDVVVINNDDPNIEVEKLIGKVRNHIFARNTMFIVFSSETSVESRRQLVISGAAQVFFHANGKNPNPKTFSNTVDWLLNLKKEGTNLFEFKFFPDDAKALAHSWGRIGYITEHQILIESNLDLVPGDQIKITSPIFDDLGIKDAQFMCVEKNTVGRYYQYANTFIGRLETKHKEQDLKKISAWIKSNASISKDKPIKVVYFEKDTDYRNEIAQMIKADKKYCARGYKDLENFDLTLNYQKPTLILINRNLIYKYRDQFDIIKKYLKNNFCYVVTYSLDPHDDFTELKNQFPSILHASLKIDLNILESMVKKLSDKMPIEDQSTTKFIPNKHSPYSRVAFHFELEITHIAIDAFKVNSPIKLSPFCSMEIESHLLLSMKLTHHQLFRVLDVRKQSGVVRYYPHELLFIGSTFKEKDSIAELIDKTQDLRHELDKKEES